MKYTSSIDMVLCFVCHHGAGSANELMAYKDYLLENKISGIKPVYAGTWLLRGNLTGIYHENIGLADLIVAIYDDVELLISPLNKRRATILNMLDLMREYDNDKKKVYSALTQMVLNLSPLE